MLKNLSKFSLGLTTVLAGAFTVGAVGYLAVDIGPSIVDHIVRTDWTSALLITGLGLSAVVFSKIIAAPFDNLMDSVYPDDVKPKEV